MKAFRATMLVSGLSVLVAGALFFALCDRYRYYDYRPARFSREQASVEVFLRGEYSEPAPTERGKPYDLIVRVSSPYPRDVSIRNVSLRSKSTRSHLKIRDVQGYLIEDADDLPTVVYRFENIDIPYADCDVEGLIDLGDDASQSGDFRVSLKTDYSAEWRLRFINMLMSV